MAALPRSQGASEEETASTVADADEKAHIEEPLKLTNNADVFASPCNQIDLPHAQHEAP